jgi:hypothetical protein
MSNTTTEQEPEIVDELFPNGTLQGDGITLQKFIKGGKEHKLAVKIKSIRVPSGAGLADPEKDTTLLVTCEPGKTITTPHKEEGKVIGYTTDQVYTPVFVEGVQRGDAGRLEAMFGQLLKDDPQGAGRAMSAMSALLGADIEPSDD